LLIQPEVIRELEVIRAVRVPTNGVRREAEAWSKGYSGLTVIRNIGIDRINLEKSPQLQQSAPAAAG
jgi:hypothetical protein